jgi:hypothetical protein
MESIRTGLLALKAFSGITTISKPANSNPFNMFISHVCGFGYTIGLLFLTEWLFPPLQIPYDRKRSVTALSL